MRQRRLRRVLQHIAVGKDVWGVRERLEQGLRTLEGRAPGMEPQRHLAFAVSIGESLAETKRVALDRAPAASALRSTGWRDLEDVWHGVRIRHTTFGYLMRMWAAR